MTKLKKWIGSAAIRLLSWALSMDAGTLSVAVLYGMVQDPDTVLSQVTARMDNQYVDDTESAYLFSQRNKLN